MNLFRFTQFFLIKKICTSLQFVLISYIILRNLIIMRLDVQYNIKSIILTDISVTLNREIGNLFENKVSLKQSLLDIKITR